MKQIMLFSLNSNIEKLKSDGKQQQKKLVHNQIKYCVKKTEI